MNYSKLPTVHFNSFIKLLLLICLVSPIALIGGDPIPDIDITAVQSISRITKSGKTNSQGELVLKGFKPGSVIINIKCNGETLVIGKKNNDRISIPSNSRSSIKPIRLDLALYSTAPTSRKAAAKKKTNNYSTSKTTGNEFAVTDTSHKDYSRSEGDTGSNQHGTSRTAGLHDGMDNDCDGIIEITVDGSGDIKIKIIAKM